MSSDYKKVIERAEEINSALRAFEQFLLTLPEDEYTSTEWAEMVYALHGVKTRAADAYKALEEIAAPMLDMETVLPNGAKVEAKNGTPRKKWDHEGLGKEVASRIVDTSFDFETGETNRTLEEMVREAYRYAGISYWRIKELKGLGLDPDRYCETGDPKISVIVRRP